MNDAVIASTQLRQRAIRPAKTLAELWPQAAAEHHALLVRDLEDNSTRIRVGDAWLCLNPEHEKAASFMAEAAASGAVICFSVGTWPEKTSLLPVCELADMEELAAVMRRWFGTENTPVRCVGVTGTDGKTSVTWMTRQALKQAGWSAWSVGTLGWLDNQGSPLSLGNTTTSLLNNHRLLAMADSAGADALVMEVSSHGIDQQRIAGLPFAVAVWTTMGRDHLDYHHDAAAYVACKSDFIHSCAGQGSAIVANAGQADIMQALADMAGVISYAQAPHPSARIQWFVPTSGQLMLQAGGTQLTVTDVPVGDIHAQNLAAVCGILCALDIPFGEAVPCLQGVSAPPGRLEAVPDVHQRQVLVDYAHTAQALAASLQAARSMSQGRLLLLFGCGGERDHEKRPQMGQAATRLADEVWLTSDNPRSEDPLSIIADVQAGMQGASVPLHIQADRAQAIREAIAAMRAGDTLLIAGKGHEDYMELANGQRIDWSDVALARQTLAAVKPC